MIRRDRLSQEERMRRKGSIGDLFVVVALVVLPAMVIANVVKDDTINKGLYTIQSLFKHKTASQ